MTQKILQIYTTREGQTAKIMAAMAEQWRQAGHLIETHRLLAQQSPAIDWHQYDQVVMGGSVHYGKHESFLADFIISHREQLNQCNTLFFSVNLTARKPAKATVANNPYLSKFLAQTGWQPTQVAVFAGALKYSQYRFWDKHIIRFIMWLTQGNTDTRLDIDYTDWPAVKALADALVR